SAFLHHEAGHVADRAAHDQQAALHRDARARAGIAPDDDGAAADSRRGAVAGVAVDDDLAGEHVFAHRPATVAGHVQARAVHHAATEIPDRPVELDADLAGKAHGQVVPSAGVAYRDRTLSRGDQGADGQVD